MQIQIDPATGKFYLSGHRKEQVRVGRRTIPANKALTTEAVTHQRAVGRSTNREFKTAAFPLTLKDAVVDKFRSLGFIIEESNEVKSQHEYILEYSRHRRKKGQTHR